MSRWCVISVSVFLSPLSMGCDCRDSEPAAPEARIDHAERFDDLVRAVSFQSAESVRERAGQLVVAPPDHQDTDLASSAGAALGMLQVAAPGEEAVEALVSLAQACGQCHAGERVQWGPATDYRHELADSWWMEQIVQGRTSGLPDDPRMGQVKPSLSMSEGATSALGQCVECHGPTRTPGSP